jgi:hypothetical protein
MISSLLIFGVLRLMRGGGTGDGGAMTRGAKSQPNTETQDDPSAFAQGGSFRGVVLIPEAKRHTVLIAPRPLRLNAALDKKHRSALEIPFDGVYWLLQFPDRIPPKNSKLIRGTPTSLGFRSTDLRFPLIMEAHQNLGSLIDLECCRTIQITISNADRYPGLVSLELILINTTLAGRPWQSLGRAFVTTMPQELVETGREPVSETLTFQAPSTSRLRQFDEVAIRFHTSGLARARRSFRIAIDRFLLVPKGAG